MKPVLVSGIQPTGKLHLGNYLGALKNFVDLQNTGDYECFFFIADLHSLTESYRPEEKPEQIMNVALDYLAAGIDPEKSVIFQQSAIPAHTELMWLLNTITPFGELRRMTQFKDKSEHEPENINVGLFSYPVLMAADILLYGAKAVPVGHDQLQHLELARTLARQFNKKFGKTFIEPQPVMTEVPRLMSLDDPSKKMSKSNPAGCVFIDDEPAVIRKKIMSAMTDSEGTIAYDEEKRPAIANLLLLYSAVSGRDIQQIADEYEGKGYADFKKGLADAVVGMFAPFQERKKALAKNLPSVKEILARGNEKADKRAEKKLAEAKIKTGISV